MKQKVVIEISSEEMFALYVQIAQLYDKAFSEEAEELSENHMLETYPHVYDFLASFKIDNLNTSYLQREYNILVKASNDVAQDIGAHVRESCKYWEEEMEDDPV